ncbi:MAG: DMT family transporter [Acidimicrobiales bacterium]
MLLAVLAGIGWATNIVIVRWGLDRTTGPPLVAAMVGVGVGSVVAATIAVVSGQAVPSPEDLWRFVLVGAIAPGTSQGLFVAAIGLIGTSRTSVLIATSPVFSVLLAIIFLGEDWKAAAIIGTLVTVIGGALIGWAPDMLERRVGVIFGLATAFSFGVRDVVARSFSTDTDVSSWWSGAIVLGSAAIVSLVMVIVKERGGTVRAVRAVLPEFLLSGLMMGLTLPTLLLALDRGEVGLVAPLSLASQNVAVVALGSVVFGADERTPRILAAIVLVIVGAAMVSIA